MSIYPECIPCILNQSLYAARTAKINDEKTQMEIMKHVIRELNNIDNFETAPEFSVKIHNIVKAFSGIDNPYEEIKVRNLKNKENAVFEYISVFKSPLHQASLELKRL